MLPLALLVSLFLVVVLGGLTGLRNSLAVVMLLWAVGRLSHERRMPPLAIPMGAWLLLAAASAMWASGAGVALKATLYDIALPAGVFYGACLLCHQTERLPYRVSCAAIVAGTILLLALVLAARVAEPTVEDSGPAGLYTGVGVTSTLAVYALPVGLLLANSGTAGFTCLGYLSLTCILVAGAASHNRMFWLSAVAVVMTFYAWQWTRLSRIQRVVPVLLVVTMASIIGTYIDVKAGRGPLEVVVRDNRPSAWREWGSIAAKAPILGYGFGLKNVTATGQDNLPIEFSRGNPEMRFHSHNLLLNIVLQTGLLGLVLFSVLLGSLVRESWRARGEPESRTVGAALAGLIVAMLAKNMTDDFMHHAGVIAFWGYAGMLVGRLSSLAGRTTGP